MRDHVFRLLLAVVLAFAAFPLARAAKKPEMRRVYLFGFAASFSDSTACQTALQPLDSAWVEPSHKFLIDRSLYGLQLQSFAEGELGVRNVIPTIFFETNPRRAQRMWDKIHRRYAQTGELNLVTLDMARFRFRPEEYHEIIQEEVAPAPADTQPAPSQPADKKRTGRRGRSGKK